MLTKLYVRDGEQKESAFFVEHTRKLSARASRILCELVAGVVPDGKVTLKPTLKGDVAQIGPRVSTVSPWSDSAIGILDGCGIKAERFEMLRRVVVPKGVDSQDLFDRMQEQIYPKRFLTFRQEMEIPKVKVVPVLQKGKDALREISKELGLGFDEQDVSAYHHLFAEILKRNPTDVEMFVLGQVNSNHCRHLDWNAEWTIDGEVQKETLFQLIKKPWQQNPGVALAAFHDNSSVIAGYPIRIAVPKHPWGSSEYVLITVQADGTLTFETHNFPTGVAPYPGAATGTGGRMRDGKAVGVGGRLLAACAGYLTGDLNIPDYKLPWEKRNAKLPPALANAEKIQREGSDGACDYNNCVGEPVILGTKRALEMRLPTGVTSDGKKVPSRRVAWFKPIMASGGIGYVQRGHVKKRKPKTKWKVVMIGGKARNVGFGGGSASSQSQGANKAKLDFDAVQRADPEIAIRDHRVIDSCIACGRRNPIQVIHDQGAGGVLNCLIELVEMMGGIIHGGKINLGDKYLAFIVRVGAEFQERYGLLIKPEGLRLFTKICQREKCPMEVLGEITGDGKFVVLNDIKGDRKKPIDFRLKDVMADLPRKRFSDVTVKYNFTPLVLPQTATIKSALNRVLRNLAVASAEMYTLKGDRSVTGLVVGQQHCGPANLPVADCGIMALSHFSKPGIVFSMGEQPLKLMLDPAAGARMAAAEAILNMAGAQLGEDGLAKTVTSVNWMWALKYLGEGSAIFKAVKALSEFLRVMGVPVRGKDSSSMLTKLDKEIIPCPREVMITLQGIMPDCRKFVTPDIKRPGESDLVLVDLGFGKNRMGGSILGQCYNQWGNDCPDVEPEVVAATFNAIQELIRRNWVLSYHDRSDGGLITTLLEMAFAGNCGFGISMGSCDMFKTLFSEEAGAVIEVSPQQTDEVLRFFKSSGVPAELIGNTEREKVVYVDDRRNIVIRESMEALRETWRETSHQLRLRQINPECALQEKRSTRSRPGISYVFPEGFKGKAQFGLRHASRAPKVAVLREIGTNSDQEMSAAFKFAGFRTFDVDMQSLETGALKNLDEFSVLAVCGGFANRDTLGSARGWAAKILYNNKLRRMFWEFLARPDTLSYWVCNGAQLAGQLGWIPCLPEEWDAPSAKGHPIFTYNASKKFESRWSVVRVLPSPSVMLNGMEWLQLGVHVAHGEGQFLCTNDELALQMTNSRLLPLRFADDEGHITTSDIYPFNPNGSWCSVTSMCSPDGRHLAAMPHLERSFQMRQWQYVPEFMKRLEFSPWMRAFENMRRWYR